MFNLALKGHHSQHMAIGLTGLTSRGLTQQVHQPLNGGGFSQQLPECQSAEGECYRGHHLGLVLYAWHFYPLVRKTMGEPQSPSITIVPFSGTTKLRGVGKVSNTKWSTGEQLNLPSSSRERSGERHGTKHSQAMETAAALRGKVNPTQRHHFSVQH